MNKNYMKLLFLAVCAFLSVEITHTSERELRSYLYQFNPYTVDFPKPEKMSERQEKDYETLKNTLSNFYKNYINNLLATYDSVKTFAQRDQLNDYIGLLLAQLEKITGLTSEIQNLKITLDQKSTEFIIDKNSFVQALKQQYELKDVNAMDPRRFDEWKERVTREIVNEVNKTNNHRYGSGIIDKEEKEKLLEDIFTAAQAEREKNYSSIVDLVPTQTADYKTILTGISREIKEYEKDGNKKLIDSSIEVFERFYNKAFNNITFLKKSNFEPQSDVNSIESDLKNLKQNFEADNTAYKAKQELEKIFIFPSGEETERKKVQQFLAILRKAGDTQLITQYSIAMYNNKVKQQPNEVMAELVKVQVEQLVTDVSNALDTFDLSTYSSSKRNEFQTNIKKIEDDIAMIKVITKDHKHILSKNNAQLLELSGAQSYVTTPIVDYLEKRLSDKKNSLSSYESGLVKTAAQMKELFDPENNIPKPDAQEKSLDGYVAKFENWAKTADQEVNKLILENDPIATAYKILLDAERKAFSAIVKNKGVTLSQELVSDIGIQNELLELKKFVREKQETPGLAERYATTISQVINKAKDVLTALQNQRNQDRITESDYEAAKKTAITLVSDFKVSLILKQYDLMNHQLIFMEEKYKPWLSKIQNKDFIAAAKGGYTAETPGLGFLGKKIGVFKSLEVSMQELRNAAEKIQSAQKVIDTTIDGSFRFADFFNEYGEITSPEIKKEVEGVAETINNLKEKVAESIINFNERFMVAAANDDSVKDKRNDVYQESKNMLKDIELEAKVVALSSTTAPSVKASSITTAKIGVPKDLSKDALKIYYNAMDILNDKKVMLRAIAYPQTEGLLTSHIKGNLGDVDYKKIMKAIGPRIGEEINKVKGTLGFDKDKAGKTTDKLVIDRLLGEAFTAVSKDKTVNLENLFMPALLFEFASLVILELEKNKNFQWYPKLIFNYLNLKIDQKNLTWSALEEYRIDKNNTPKGKTVSRLDKVNIKLNYEELLSQRNVANYLEDVLLERVEKAQDEIQAISNTLASDQVPEQDQLKPLSENYAQIAMMNEKIWLFKDLVFFLSRQDSLSKNGENYKNDILDISKLATKTFTNLMKPFFVQAKAKNPGRDNVNDLITYVNNKLENARVPEEQYVQFEDIFATIANEIIGKSTTTKTKTTKVTFTPWVGPKKETDMPKTIKENINNFIGDKYGEVIIELTKAGKDLNLNEIRQALFNKIKTQFAKKYSEEYSAQIKTLIEDYYDENNALFSNILNTFNSVYNKTLSEYAKYDDEEAYKSKLFDQLADGTKGISIQEAYKNYTDLLYNNFFSYDRYGKKLKPSESIEGAEEEKFLPITEQQEENPIVTFEDLEKASIDQVFADTFESMNKNAQEILLNMGWEDLGFSSENSKDVIKRDVIKDYINKNQNINIATMSVENFISNFSESAQFKLAKNNAQSATLLNFFYAYIKVYANKEYLKAKKIAEEEAKKQEPFFSKLKEISKKN